VQIVLELFLDALFHLLHLHVMAAVALLMLPGCRVRGMAARMLGGASATLGLLLL